MLVRRIMLCLVVVVAILQAPLAASANPGITVSSIALEGSPTAVDLVNSLVGDNVTVDPQSILYTGAYNASGTFSSDPESIVGFGSGVLMTTGDVANVVGPNDTGSAGTDNGLDGDSDLDALSNETTYDASVLQFDFTSTQDMLSFQYVFASEEYPEFVNQGFNDTFGFFVNGTNCATVGDGQPVTVDTVNAGSNSSLFRDNSDASIDTQMDGLTTVLTCTAPVSTTETNHIKLAIADGGDHIYDSAVFLKAGSFSSEPGGADLSISKSDTATGSGPDPVSSGDIVAYRVSVTNNGPDDATGISVTDSPDGGTVVGASGDGWSCSNTSTDATCTMASLANGATAAPITVLVQAPSTAEGTTITNTATVSSDSDPNSENNTATETTTVQPSGTLDTASGFCPSTGCTISTGTNATATDPTVSSITVPAGADPQVITMHETSGADTTLCGGGPCSGQILTFTSSPPPTFSGVTDPKHPAVVTMTFDKTVKGGSQIYVDKGNGPVLVPNCKKTGVAKPHPCVSQRNIEMPNGDRRFVILFLEGDPTIGKK
jgi:uncharacterized repeat protein (TIGR01451 family)